MILNEESNCFISMEKLRTFKEICWKFAGEKIRKAKCLSLRRKKAENFGNIGKVFWFLRNWRLWPSFWAMRQGTGLRSLENVIGSSKPNNKKSFVFNFYTLAVGLLQATAFFCSFSLRGRVVWDICSAFNFAKNLNEYCAHPEIGKSRSINHIKVLLFSFW